MKRLCIILVGFVFFVSSCDKDLINKENSQTSETALLQSFQKPDNSNFITKKIFKEQVQYSSLNLKNIAKLVLSKLDDDRFRQLTSL